MGQLIEKEYIVSSDIGNVKIVDVILHSVRQHLALREKDVFSIRLALTESITNAIIHGNEMDSTKRVKIKLNYDNYNLQFCIVDEGLGFEIDSIPDPTKDDNLSKCGGRGVFLIKKLSSSCFFDRNTNALNFSFVIQ